VERDVRDEVEFHLEMQVRVLIERGYTAEAARAEALRRFGNVAGVERRLLEMDWRRERRMRRWRALRDLRRDAGFALRGLRRRPVFALVAVLTLALGMGATASVFALVDGALLRPLPFPDEEELVYVRDVQDGESGYPASLAEFDDWLASLDFLAGAMTFATRPYTLTGEGSAELVMAGMVRGAPLATLGLRPLIGRSFGAAELDGGANVVLLDEVFWSERYARRSDVLGRTLRLSDEPYEVIGVMAREAGALRAGNPPQVWMPMDRHPAMTRGLHFLDVIARLRPHVSVEQAGLRADAAAARIIEAGETTHGIALVRLREVLVGDARAVLLLLMAAVAVVLLIVCANVANLVLAQAFDRRREFAVRIALGAGQVRLARQVITESIVLGLAGGIAGMGVAWLLSRTVNAVSVTAGFLAPAALDARVLAFMLLLSVLVAVLFGVWPALRVGRSDLAETLRRAGDARSLGGRGALGRRRLLAGAELALCVVLLAGAGLLARSMVNLLRQDTGFDARGVLTFWLSLPGPRYDDVRRTAFLDDLVARLEAMPGVEHAAMVSHLPLERGDTYGGFEIVGRAFPEGEDPHSKKRIASAGYFEALGIPLLAGRTFTERDRAGAPEVVIITESLARRYWPDGDALGSRVRYLWGSEGEQEVVGLVGDVKHDGLDRPADGMIFRPAGQFVQSGFAVVVKGSGDPLRRVDAVRAAVRAVDPDVPVRVPGTMESIVSGSVTGRRTIMMLISAFATLALVLATVGVYAIAAQSVSQRTSEIGLRMAVGAGRADVVRLIVRAELPAILVGALAGLAGAVAATRMLDAWLFGVAATDGVTLASAVALLALVAILATWIPARRAARLDPLRALRTEG